ncbi:MAG TPA: site-specific integrase [Chloroflexota bacterium]
MVDVKRGRIIFRPRYRGIDYLSYSVRLDLPPAEREAENKARRLAEAALAELKRRVDRGETPSPAAERRTVGEAVAAFLEEVRASKGEHSSTLRLYRQWCKRITDAPIARLALRDLRRHHVATWLGKLREQGETAVNRRGAFDRLLQVCAHALAEDTQLQNLRALLDARKELRPTHQSAETVPFTPDETRLILVTGRAQPIVDGVPIGPIAAVCVYAKARIGEACGLRQRDVDAFSETLTLAHKIGHTGRPEAVTKSKQAASVPVAPELVAWLLEHRREEQARGRRYGPDDLLFVDRKKRGEAPVTYARARAALEELTALAGLAPSGATHRLRHASAMLSLEAGTPLPVIQRQLRHRDLATTAAYLHHDDRLARQDARAVGERLKARWPRRRFWVAGACRGALTSGFS